MGDKHLSIEEETSVMILKILIAGMGIFAGTYFFKGFISRMRWMDLFLSLLLAVVNAGVYAVVKFLPSTWIWIGFILLGLVVNFLLLQLMDKMLQGIALKNTGRVMGFAVYVSVLCAVLYWLI